MLNRAAGGKNGKLSCCKCIFDQIKANLAEIQPENRQNVQKCVFLQKAPGVNGLRISFLMKHRPFAQMAPSFE